MLDIGSLHSLDAKAYPLGVLEKAFQRG